MDEWRQSDLINTLRRLTFYAGGYQLSVFDFVDYEKKRLRVFAPFYNGKLRPDFAPRFNWNGWERYKDRDAQAVGEQLIDLTLSDDRYLPFDEAAEIDIDAQREWLEQLLDRLSWEGPFGDDVEFDYSVVGDTAIISLRNGFELAEFDVELAPSLQRPIDELVTAFVTRLERTFGPVESWPQPTAADVDQDNPY
jgi:hypothetical protein